MKSRKHIILIIGVSLGFALFLAVGRPLKGLIENYGFDETLAQMVAGILVRSFILIALVIVMRKLQVSRFLGIDQKPSIKGVQPMLIPLVIILMSLFGDTRVYINAGLGLLTLFLIDNLLVALVEELTFRGVILPLIIKTRLGKKHIILVSVIMASSIFGLMHYLNLFREPGNFLGITSQVVFATSIGIYLGGLLLRTRNIFFPIVIHFLVNVAFGKGVLRPDQNEVLTNAPGDPFEWSSFLLTMGIFACIAIGGIYTIRQVDTKKIISTLSLKKQDYEIQ